MGKALCQQFSAARSIMQRADAALGHSISRLCLEGPESELVLTANAQPAILAVSIAALEGLREALGEFAPPRFTAGHSLGEYTALVAAGALELEDALRLVQLRGRAMQQAVPEGRGGMAALIGADHNSAIALCEASRESDVLEPANYNAPGQIVIAGTTEALQRATTLASSFKIKLIPLKVSAPFHCALMQPAARAVEQALEEISFHPLRFPIVSNVDARPNQDPARAKELLVTQVCSPVRWEHSVQWIHAAGVRQALEIGPGKVLAGLVKRIEKTLSVHGVSDPESVGRTPEFLVSAAGGALPA
jgi:[acyl-carrier-protein] S-malonyltransferase